MNNSNNNHDFNFKNTRHCFDDVRKWNQLCDLPHSYYNTQRESK